jgi:hypothetical protein
MLRRRVFWASLIVALVVLAMVANRGAPQHVLTGVIGDFHAGEWLVLTGENLDPQGVQIALRKTTTYEAESGVQRLNPVLIRKGLRVRVWYRSVGERRGVADRVRVLPNGTAR